MSESPSRGRSRGPRARRCCCSCLLAAVLVPLAVYLVAWGAGARRFSAELARLQQAGEPLQLSAVMPKVAKDTDNAAAIYERAFSLQPGGLQQYTGRPQWTSADASAARQLVADNGEYFDALAEASRRPLCVFDKDWEAIPNLDLPEFARFRDAGRDLVVKAETERVAGRIDDAASSCLTALRLAGHAHQTPVLVGYLVSAGVQSDALQELERVLSSGDPSPSACRALYDELGRQEDLEPFVTALRGERTCHLAIFKSAEKRGAIRGQWPGTERANPAFDLYPTLGKPWWNQDKANVVRSTQWLIEAAGRPYAEAVGQTRDGARAVQRMPFFSSILTRLMFPILDHSLGRARRSVAETGAARLAVAATAFHRTHGRYPASLEELAGDGWRLPRDPFTDEPYHYAREGNGLTVWSVGPDLADNRGADWDRQFGKEDQPGTDFAFHCRR